MFDTMEELFTPDEIAVKKAEKTASALQSATDRLATAREAVGALEAEVASLTPAEVPETPAGEVVPETPEVSEPQG